MLEIIGVVIFVLGLGLSIALHEIGHLLPAKLFGVRVTQYMVGFGPTLWSRVKGETEYGVKAIPMGGYIRMIGMFPPNPDGTKPFDARGRFGTMIEEAREASLAEIAPGEQHRAFYRLSAPRKLVIMFGGPFMNLVLAFLIFSLSFGVIGWPNPSNTLNSVLACVPTDSNPSGIASTDGGCGTGQQTPAAQAGLQPMDVVTAINGTNVIDWWGLRESIGVLPIVPLTVEFLRDGKSLTTRVNPIEYEIDDYNDDGSLTGSKRTVAFIGVTPGTQLNRQSLSTVPGFMSNMAIEGAKSLASFPINVARLGVGLFSNQERNPNGPVSVIGMGRISGDIVGNDSQSAAIKLSSYLNLLASMNMFLFLFNLLPILPLDGGHLAGATFEGLRRVVRRLRGKTVSGPADTARLLPLAYLVSFALIGMSLVVMIADIIKPISV